MKWLSSYLPIPPTLNFRKFGILWNEWKWDVLFELKQWCLTSQSRSHDLTAIVGKQVVLLSSGLRMFKLPNFWDGINNRLFFEQNFCYQPQQGPDFIQQSFYGPRLEFVLQKGYQYDYILFDCV